MEEAGKTLSRVTRGGEGEGGEWQRIRSGDRGIEVVGPEGWLAVSE